MDVKVFLMRRPVSNHNNCIFLFSAILCLLNKDTKSNDLISCLPLFKTRSVTIETD